MTKFFGLYLYFFAGISSINSKLTGLGAADEDEAPPKISESQTGAPRRWEPVKFQVVMLILWTY